MRFVLVVHMFISIYAKQNWKFPNEDIIQCIAKLDMGDDVAGRYTLFLLKDI